jgi:hypothetical protein
MFTYLFNNKVHINGGPFRYLKNLGFGGKKIIYIYILWTYENKSQFENIKFQYYKMVKVFKIRFSNMSSLNNKI